MDDSLRYSTGKNKIAVSGGVNTGEVFPGPLLVKVRIHNYHEKRLFAVEVPCLWNVYCEKHPCGANQRHLHLRMTCGSIFKSVRGGLWQWSLTSSSAVSENRRIGRVWKATRKARTFFPSRSYWTYSSLPPSISSNHTESCPQEVNWVLFPSNQRSDTAVTPM